MPKGRSAQVQRPVLTTRARRPTIDDALETEGGVEETALARVEEATVALGAFSSRADFSPEDVFIPNLRLAQGLSAEVQDGSAKPGEWLVTGFEPVDEVTVVPLMFGKARELRDEDDRSVILCRSNDSIVGIGNPGGTCVDCPLSQWGEKRDGTRVPPKCNFQYKYLVYSVEHETLATLSFSKTALRAGKVMNTSVAKFGLANIVILLKSESKKGPNGTFHSPTVVPQKADPKVLDVARSALQEMV
jgi:hypothetical protein